MLTNCQRFLYNQHSAIKQQSIVAFASNLGILQSYTTLAPPVGLFESIRQRLNDR